MNKFSSYLLGLAVAGLVVGCGAGTPSLVGKWKVDTSKLPASSDAMTKSMTEAASKMISLEFKADKTCALSIMFPLSGSYTQEGKHFRIHLTSVMGMDMSKLNNSQTSNQNQDIDGTISDDGNSLTLDGTPGQAKSQQPMAFLRDKG